MVFTVTSREVAYRSKSGRGQITQGRQHLKTRDTATCTAWLGPVRLKTIRSRLLSNLKTRSRVMNGEWRESETAGVEGANAKLHTHLSTSAPIREGKCSEWGLEGETESTGKILEREQCEGKKLSDKGDVYDPEDGNREKREKRKQAVS